MLIALILLAAALLPSCSPAPPDQKGETAPQEEAASPPELNFHRLKVEPLVHSTYPTYRRFHDGLAPQVVVITAEGLERIGWEDRPAKSSWILRLSEQIYLNGRKLHYQVGMQWSLEGAAWSYTDAPVKDLNDLWKRDPEKGFQLDPSAEKRPLLGRQSASVYADSRGAHYSLVLTNDSGEEWKDVYAFICVSHYHTPVTGYRPYLKIGSSWTEYQKIPGVGPATFLPVTGRVEDYTRVQAGSRGAPAVSFPGVLCWNITNKGHLLTAHLSIDSLAVRGNQNAPCTDQFLWFRDMKPGQQVTRRGHFLVAEASLESFEKQDGALLQQLDEQ